MIESLVMWPQYHLKLAFIKEYILSEKPLFFLVFLAFFVLHNMWVIHTENQFSDNYIHVEHLLSNMHFEHLIWRYMDIMVIFLSWNPSWVIEAANFNFQLLHGSYVYLLGYLFTCLNIMSLMIIEIDKNIHQNDFISMRVSFVIISLQIREGAGQQNRTSIIYIRLTARNWVAKMFGVAKQFWNWQGRSSGRAAQNS